MAPSVWIAGNWFDLVQTAAIIGSLVFTGYTIRRDTRARKISNSITISERRYDIWKELYAYPKLLRVMDEQPDLKREPISRSEELFVNNLVVHLSTAYRAVRDDELVRLEGLRKDVKAFFALPIPKQVWEKIRPFHDRVFVDFIDSLLK